jgi:hypothetical protein
VSQDKWQLEEWFLEAGEAAERAIIAGKSLSAIQSLIREFWVFDIHTQNGGVSQYFCNHGLERWQTLRSVWMSKEVPSLGPILTGVDRVLAGSEDPYQATLEASPGIEDLYEAHQLDVKRELRRLAEAK